MPSRGTRFLALVILGTNLSRLAAAEVAVSSTPEPHTFGGAERELEVQFQNTSEAQIALDLRYRVYQASSGSLAPLGPATRWKSVAIGPGQTVRDAFRFAVPAVRGVSMFQVNWYNGELRIGTTRFWAHANQLLQPLSVLAGEDRFGLIDPEGDWTNALAGLRFDRLNDAETIRSFAGKLILVAPTAAETNLAGLKGALKSCAASGAGVVWVQPPAHFSEVPVVSSAFVLERGTGRLVIAEPSLLEHLARSPTAQLRLVSLAELAVGRKKLGLPGESSADLVSRGE